MSFVPLVGIHKSGDRLTVTVRQRYNPRGCIEKVIHIGPGIDIEVPKIAHRWRVAGVFSLKELQAEEKKGEGSDTVSVNGEKADYDKKIC